MIDVGLQSGVKTLWLQDMFVDYTIKVSGQKFQVHKLVLASVSDYFRTMLNGAMMERVKDEVEFTQFSAQLMSKLIKFIYTGSDSILLGNTKEFLECGVYFQMPKVIKACTSSLIKGVTVPTCLDLLATFVNFSLHDAAAQVRSFITRNAAKVMNRFRTREMSEDVMRVILKCWKKSDWEMFIYLTTWFSADFENRKDHLNEFMGRVRFSQLNPREIEAIKDMDVYKDGEGVWKEQVGNAFQGKASYEDLPIYRKVLADPEQSAVRGTKALYIMDTDPASGGAAFAVNKYKWKQCWKSKGLEVSGTIPFVIEVNNFLVTCSEFGKNQTWQIFDPRTLTWSKIANMSKPRDEFAMVYHDKHLYVLGGTEESAQKEKVLTDTVEVYSFETNIWSSTNIKLPVPVKNHAACVLNGAIYISGGEVADKKDTHLSDRLDRLDISSKCWECKAPMATAMSHHPMIVMKKERKEVIFVLNEDMALGYYDLVMDEWLKWDHNASDYPQMDQNRATFKFQEDFKWVPGESRLLGNGHFLYLLNLRGMEMNDDDDDSSDSVDVDDMGVFEPIEHLCEKWKMLEYEDMEKYQFDYFPCKNAVVALLAVPKHVK